MPKENSAHLNKEHQPAYYQTDEDEISLGDLIASLWRNRSTIVVFSLASFFSIALLCLGIYFSQERYEVISQEFKLEFEGIDKNEYPGGLKFSTADILSTPVLRTVYTQNDLQNFLEFHDFKTALAISQTNDTLELLEYEYAAKLSNQKLSIDERDKIETMFLEKKKNALIPVYTLSFRLPKKLNSLPKSLTPKVLNDILATWADVADRNKGANKYQIFLVSANIIDKEKLLQEDYLVAADIFRANILRTKKDIQKVMEIPGASSIRITDSHISLQDLAFRIEDLQRFRLNQMLGLLRATGITKNKTIAAGYLQNQIFELDLDKEKAKASLAVYQNSLHQYLSQAGMAGQGGSRADATAATLLQQSMGRDVASIIPQFSGTFLENLQKMSEENSDNAYRQGIINNITKSGLKEVDIDGELRWYNEILAKITDTSKKDELSTQSAPLLDKIFNEIYSTMLQTINELNTIYLELSKHNLNPASTLYTQTEPALHKVESSLSLKKLVMIGILTLLAAEGAIFITILMKEGLRKKREEEA